MDKDRLPVTSLVHTSLLLEEPGEICAIELIKAGLDKEKRGDVARIDRSEVMMCQRGIKMPFTQFGFFNDFNINSALSQKKAIFYLHFLDLVIITSAKNCLMLIKAYLRKIIFLCKPSNEEALVIFISMCTNTHF